MLKKIRIFLWGAVICVLLVICWLFFQKGSVLQKHGLQGEGIPITASFDLVDQKGNRRTEQDYKRKYMLIYFGYSYCPDICPTGLQSITDALKLLGPVAGKIQPIFITVDPARDTTGQLATYMENFHPTFVALTGSDAKVEEAKKAFRVYAAKYQGKEETESSDYLVDHSSIVYLVGPGGKYLTHFTHATPPEEIAQTIREIIYN